MSETDPRVPTDTELLRMGYDFALTFGDPPTFAAAVIRHVGGSRLCAGCNQWGYERAYDYATHGGAVGALAEWYEYDFKGEPTGWIRCVNDGRRRTDGTPATEYVRE